MIINKITFLYKKIISIKQFGLFIGSMTILEGKNIVLNHVENWHYLTFYRNRNKEYLKIVKRYYDSTIVNLNLRSSIQINTLIQILESDKSYGYLEILIIYLKNVLLEKFRKSKSEKITKNYKINLKYLPVTEINCSVWDICIKLPTVIKKTKKEIPLSSRMYYEKIVEDYRDVSSINSKFTERLKKLLIHNSVKYLLIPQFSYQDQLFLFYAKKFHVSVFMFESIYSDFTVFTPNALSRYERLSSYFYNKVSQINLNDEEKEKYTNELSMRIAGNYNAKTMGYMKDVKLNVDSVKAPKGTCILFLHCFLDAPNAMIEDSSQSIFPDYFNQARNVIILAASLKIPLLIKPHPQNEIFKGDKYLLQSLRILVDKIKTENSDVFIEWLSDKISNKSLLGIENAFAVTARGTVSMECGFMGIPIALTKSHEWEKLSFIKRVKSENELRNYLQNPYQEYNSESSIEESIKLQAFISKKTWSKRPGCINIYSTTPGEISSDEMAELYERRMEI